MTAINESRLKAELEALVDHANERGLDSADLNVMCAIMTGLTIRAHGGRPDQRRQVLGTLYGIMADHAGVSKEATH